MVDSKTLPEDMVDAKQDEELERSPEPGAVAAGKGAKPKRDFSQIVRSFITPERIIGVILVLLIPCFLTSWIQFPITEKVGIQVEYSMPKALSAGSSVVGKLEAASDGLSELEQLTAKAAEIAEKAVNVAAVATAALTAGPDDYKAALTKAISELVDSVVDESKPLASKAASKVEEAATSAANTAVDNAAAAIEGTKVQEGIGKAADAAATAGEAAQNAQAAAEKAQSAVNKAQEKLQSTLHTVKTVLTVVNVGWYGFLLLLLVAGILLIVGIRGRYVTGIVALSLSIVGSLGAIIGVAVANQAVLDALTNSVGIWIAAFVTSIVGVTAWPWAVAVASIIALVVLCVLLKKHRKQLNAAQGQAQLESANEEPASQEKAIEA